MGSIIGTAPRTDTGIGAGPGRPDRVDRGRVVDVAVPQHVLPAAPAAPSAATGIAAATTGGVGPGAAEGTPHEVQRVVKKG